MERAAEAFGAAARVLAQHSDALYEAQQQSRRAIGIWQDAPTPGPVPSGATPDDLGAVERARAEQMILDARARLAESDRRVTAALQEAGEAAPNEPGLFSRAMHALHSFGAGAVEATTGLALTNLESLGKGLLYGIEHPADFGKALIDYDTWKSNPARALGHLVPDLLLAIATGGAGSGAAAVDGVRGAQRAGKAMKELRRTVDLMDDVGGVGWVGKGLSGEGLKLGTRESFAADLYRARAMEVEQSLSPRIESLMEANGAKPLGWESRLKGEDSLKRKLATGMGDDDSLDVVAELADIQDSVRYTMGFDEADYAARTRSVTEAMKAQGFREVKFKNYWGDDGYQGINAIGPTRKAVTSSSCSSTPRPVSRRRP